MTGKPLRLVIAEDHVLLREGVCRIVDSVDGLEVVSSCADLAGLLDAARATEPDVVVTDIRMPPTRTDEGIRAAQVLRRQAPDIGVVVLSQYVDPLYVRALLEGGSEGRGYLLKERVGEVDELLDAIRVVAEGGSVIDPKVVEVLVRTKTAWGSPVLKSLTRREAEVLAEIAKGKSNAAIAQRLVLTQRAVEKHISSIFSKLGLSADQETNPRVQAVLLYLAQAS